MTEFQNPPLTVDAILEHNDSVLMIRRKSDTFDGYLAFPGGFVDYGEMVENAVKREIMEELGIKVTPYAILGVYSDPNRDPRGHVVSVVYICKFEGKPKAGDDADSFEWVTMKQIDKEDLAFDHDKIFNDYKKWKNSQETFWSSKI